MTDSKKTRLLIEQSNVVGIREREVWEYVRLTPKQTGLSFDVYADNGGAYQHNNHKLWMYVVINSEKVPFTVEEQPSAVFFVGDINFDYEKLVLFIRKNRVLLKKLADGTIDNAVFFHLLKRVDECKKEEVGIICEMATNLNAFRKGWRRINETSTNRLMNHGKYGFIIVSGCRCDIFSDNLNNDLTPEYEKWCKKEGCEIEVADYMNFWLIKRNMDEDKNLLCDLRVSKYAYSKVCVGYKGSDGVTDIFVPSFIVYCHAKEDAKAYLNFDELFKFGLTIAKRYKQDCIYVQKPNDAAIYVNCEGVKVNARESKDFIFNDYTQQYYTSIKRKKRTTQDYKDKNGKARLETPPQRFTADIQFESLYRIAGPSTYNERMKRQKEGEVFLDK